MYEVVRLRDASRRRLMWSLWRAVLELVRGGSHACRKWHVQKMVFEVARGGPQEEAALELVRRAVELADDAALAAGPAGLAPHFARERAWLNLIDSDRLSGAGNAPAAATALRAAEQYAAAAAAQSAATDSAAPSPLPPAAERVLAHLAATGSTSTGSLGSSLMVQPSSSGSKKVAGRAGPGPAVAPAPAVGGWWGETVEGVTGSSCSCGEDRDLAVALRARRAAMAAVAAAGPAARSEAAEELRVTAMDVSLISRPSVRAEAARLIAHAAAHLVPPSLSVCVRVSV